MSIRSTGATAAQAEKYLEGIEGAMNRVQVAWEKISSTLIDSKAIINLLDFTASTIKAIAPTIDFFANNLVGQSITYGLIASAITVIISRKIIENNLAKEQLTLQREQEIYALKKRKEELILQTAKKVGLEVGQAELQQDKAGIEAAEAKNALIEKENVLKAKGNEIEQQKLTDPSLDTTALDKNITKAKDEFNDANDKATESTKALTIAQAEQNTEVQKLLKNNEEYKGIQKQLTLLENSRNKLVSVGLMLQSLKIIKTAAMNMGEKISIALNHLKTQGIKGLTKALWGQVAAQTAVNASNPIGWIIIGVGAVAALTAGILSLGNWLGWFKSKEEKVTEELGKLNNEMYELQNRIDTFDKATSSFDKLDNKLIKTNADLEEMNKLLDEAANSMSEEEQEQYNRLRTNSERRKYIEDLQKKDEADLEEKRKQVNKTLNKLDRPGQRSAYLNAGNEDARMAIDTIKATNNAELYKALEQMNLDAETSANIREVAQNILENGSADQVDKWMQTGYAAKLATVLSSLQKIKTAHGEIGVAEILTDDNAALTDRVKAFESISEALQSNKEALDAFQKQYGQYKVFADMGEDVLNFVDKAKLSIDDLNELYAGWKNIQKAGVDITKEQYESLFPTLMKTLAATDGDIAYATEQVFREYLNQFEYGSKEWNKAYNAFINSFGDLVAVGVLNMGQNIDALKNTVDNFYDKARKWNTMSETDKTSFISDNSDLFAGEGGEELLKAFQTGNYNIIQEALSNNEGLRKRIAQRAQEVEQELKIEMAKVGDARNEAYIAQLQSYMDYLSDEEKLFQISLEDRLEQEKEQLDQYKSYLEDQKSALEDSLNKRKEAYEKYFDAIKKGEEDQEFEEQVDLITTNLSKLGSSTNASAQNQRSELERQLQELEKERLQDLREKAQEQIINHMDETIDEINKKFDDLLNSNQALLQAMTGELDNPIDFISKQLAMAAKNGATDLEMEDLINTLQQTYGSILSDFNWKQLDFSRDENNNLVLNVNGHNTTISGEQGDTLYQAILKALTQIGYKGRI